MTQIILVAHDIRSTHNVGSLLRTAEGLGVSKVYLTGYTPYPLLTGDARLPHLAQKINRQIRKTALGAESLVPIEQSEDASSVISGLKTAGFNIVGLEQSPTSVALHHFKPPQKIALLVGREVEGIAPELQSLCDQLLEIPMFGQKESFNVVQAAAMALYQFRFHTAKA